jgi:hypothetical protein
LKIALPAKNKQVVKIIFALLFFTGSMHAQNACAIEKIGFSSNEVLDYEVFYDWGLIWVNAGKASFSVKHREFHHKNMFYFVGEGSTHSGYDWFFKVRDTFQCWVDTATLKPTRFIRNSREGGNRVYNDSYFNYPRKLVTCNKLIKGKIKADSVKLKECTYDVLSMIYYARCINYANYKVGAKIPISLYLDGEINDTLYIRYLGEEKLKTDIGEKTCSVFSPLLVKGTIFSGGENMKVWVTNDEKKIPVLITTEIVVGKIQVKIKSVKGYKSG